MIDESLLKSNFIGRDGFRWWMGQIPPEPYDQQGNNGWGNRFKVRILGYHPLDEQTLSNEDLPWALVMLPTTAGTGGAGRSASVRISAGDIVFGFFMDGDDAQQPVIMGALGGTADWNKDAQYSFPFQPFTGYTSKIQKPPASRSTANQTNEQNVTSNQAPIQTDEKNASKIGRACAAPSIGKVVTPANTCENTTVSTTEAALQNLLKKFEKYDRDLNKLQQDIDKTAEVIKGSAGWLVGEIFKYIDKQLVGDENGPGLIPNALNSLYVATYTPLVATAGPAVAHQTAAETIKSFSPAVEAVEVALICIGNAIVEGLLTLIKELLYALLENLENFAECVVDQFITTLLNSVVSAIEEGLSGVLGGITSLLGSAIDIVSLALEAISFFDSLESAFDCNQTNKKCDGAKTWTVGAGPKDSKDVDESFDNMFNLINEGAGLVNDAINIGQDVTDGLGELTGGFTDFVSIFNGDSLLPDSTGSIGECSTALTDCGPAEISIFGGGGTGAEAIPIFGDAVVDVLTNSSLGQNINQTSGIIGAVITNSGSGYQFPPYVEISDSCGLGYGAQADAILDPNGGIGALIVTSPGDFNPISTTGITSTTPIYGTVTNPITGSLQPSGIVTTGIGTTGIITTTGVGIGSTTPIIGIVTSIITSPGTGYTSGIVTSNNNQEYSITTNAVGSIISATPINISQPTQLEQIPLGNLGGTGGVVYPVFGFILPSTPTGVISIIDCVT